MKDIVELNEKLKEKTEKDSNLQFGIIKSKWNEIMGDSSSYLSPLWLKNGILYLNTNFTLYIHHFTLEKQNFINRINNLLEITAVKDIHIKYGSVNSNKPIEESEEEPTLPKNEIQKMSVVNKTTINDMIEKLKKEQKAKNAYLISTGHKKCPICNTYFVGEKKYCVVCIAHKKYRDYEKKLEEKIE